MPFFPLAHSRKKFIETSLENKVVTDYFLDEIENSLENSSVSNIVRTDGEISFQGAIFRFVWNGWDFLNGISGMNIKLYEKENGVVLEQKLFFTEFFVIGLCFSLIPAALSYHPEWSVMALIIIWGLFYLGSMLISVSRFNSFINKITHQIYERENRELNEQLTSGVYG